MARTTIRAAILAAALALAAGPAAAAEYVMRIAVGPGPQPDHYFHTPLQEFEVEVEKNSAGRIDVQIFWNFALGTNEIALGRVAEGEIEAAIGSDGHAAPYFPDVQVLGIPYLFLDRRIAHQVLDGPFGKELAERMAAASGIRPLVWMENGGYRHFSANVPLKGPEDMAGLRIRTMSNPVHMQIVRSLGATPEPIDWADLYKALQDGEVDGQENALSTFRIPKLEQVQKFIILDGHVYSILSLFVSEDWFQHLPPDLRETLVAAAQNMLARNRVLSVENEERDRAYLEEHGVTIFEPDVAMKIRFRDLTQGPAIDSLKGQVDRNLLEDLIRAVFEAEGTL